jgi:hypothetical protein
MRWRISKERAVQEIAHPNGNYSFTTVGFSSRASRNQSWSLSACTSFKTKKEIVMPGGGVEPPRAEARRILRPSTVTPKPRFLFNLQQLAKFRRCVR